MLLAHAFSHTAPIFVASASNRVVLCGRTSVRLPRLKHAHEIHRPQLRTRLVRELPSRDDDDRSNDRSPRPTPEAAAAKGPQRREGAANAPDLRHAAQILALSANAEQQHENATTAAQVGGVEIDPASRSSPPRLRATIPSVVRPPQSRQLARP